MRPKLKDYVFFAPVEEGVLLRGFSGQAVLRGSDIYRWVERLAPYLDGQHDLDELVGNMEATRGAMVESLVRRLCEADLVRDADGDIRLSRQQAETYASSLAYLEQMHAAPNRVFVRFRENPVLVAGSGQGHFALVRGLVEMGLQRVYTWTASGGSTEQHLDDLMESYSRTDRGIDWQRLDSTSLPDDILENCSAAIYVGDEYGDEHALGLLRACTAGGKVFLSGGRWGDQLFVGPLVEPSKVGCLECALTRLGQTFEQKGDTHKDLTSNLGPVQDCLLGNLMAFWMFCHLTGSPTPEQGSGLLRLDPDTLSTATHPLIPWPHCSLCGASSKAGDGERSVSVQLYSARHRNERDRELFSENASRLVDCYSGILESVDAGEYEQLPLHQVRVTVRRLPSVGLAGAEVLVPGRSSDTAHYRAMRVGLAAYAQALAQGPCEHWWSSESRELAAVFDTDWVFVTGRTFWEWLGTGLLELARKRVRHEIKRGAGLKPLGIEELLDEPLDSYVKALRLRFDIPVEGCSVGLRTAAFPGAAVALRSHGVLLSLCVDTNHRLALERCLVNALHQAQNNLQTRAEANGIMLSTSVDHGLVHDLPSEETDWSWWTEEAMNLCDSRGIEILVQPSSVDEAVSDVGLVMGYVGVALHLGEGGQETFTGNAITHEGLSEDFSPERR